MMRKQLIVITLIMLVVSVITSGTFFNTPHLWVADYPLSVVTLNESESFAATVSFVGSASSDVYHYPWCFHVNRIKEEKQVRFPTAAAAEAQGYHPCSICNPPQ